MEAPFNDDIVRKPIASLDVLKDNRKLKEDRVNSANHALSRINLNVVLRDDSFIEFWSIEPKEPVGILGKDKLSELVLVFNNLRDLSEGK